MQQCRFCGTFNDPSIATCMTCDTALHEASHTHASDVVQSPYVQSGWSSHDRPLPPKIDATEVTIEKDLSKANLLNETASLGAVHVLDDDTVRLNVKPYLEQISPHSQTARYPAAQGSMQSVDASTSDPEEEAIHALNAQKASSAWSLGAPHPLHNSEYELDYAGFDDTHRFSSQTRFFLIGLSVLIATLLGFVLYMVVSDSDADESKMAARKKGPDLSSPRGRALHALTQAKIHIRQQRWGEAKQSLAQASSASNDAHTLQKIRVLQSTMHLEKRSQQWFQYALKSDQKGRWEIAFEALKKVAPSAHIAGQAQMLKKRILNVRLKTVLSKARRSLRRKRYTRAYILALRIERIAPQYRSLGTFKRSSYRLLRRSLYKRKVRCRHFCRRRYRRRRRRKKACYTRCSKRSKLPSVKPIVLPTQVDAIPRSQKSQQSKKNVPKRVAVSRCSRRCRRSQRLYTRCQKRCTRYRIRRCRRYFYRRYRSRRYRSRRNRLIRKKCRVARYVHYCRVSRSRRACRRSYTRWKKCPRSCR